MVIKPYPVPKIILEHIEFPFGVRHYFHLKNSSVFINALFLPWKDILLKDDIVTRVGYEKTMDINLNPSFAFGVGAKKGRFKTELRAYTQKNFLAVTPIGLQAT